MKFKIVSAMVVSLCYSVLCGQTIGSPDAPTEPEKAILLCTIAKVEEGSMTVSAMNNPRFTKEIMFDQQTMISFPKGKRALPADLLPGAVLLVNTERVGKTLRAIRIQINAKAQSQ